MLMLTSLYQMHWAADRCRHTESRCVCTDRQCKLFVALKVWFYFTRLGVSPQFPACTGSASIKGSAQLLLGVLLERIALGFIGLRGLTVFYVANRANLIGLGGAYRAGWGWRS